jgi:opacity protein-like surface antigen
MKNCKHLNIKPTEVKLTEISLKRLVETYNRCENTSILSKLRKKSKISFGVEAMYCSSPMGFLKTLSNLDDNEVVPLFDVATITKKRSSGYQWGFTLGSTKSNSRVQVALHFAQQKNSCNITDIFYNGGGNSDEEVTYTYTEKVGLVHYAILPNKRVNPFLTFGLQSGKGTSIHTSLGLTTPDIRETTFNYTIFCFGGGANMAITRRLYVQVAYIASAFDKASLGIGYKLR